MLHRNKLAAKIVHCNSGYKISTAVIFACYGHFLRDTVSCHVGGWSANALGHESQSLQDILPSSILRQEEFLMSVKASVSISDQQDAFARRLVEDGRYASVSAVVQRGLELVREETELKDAELAALRALLKSRADSEFISLDEGRRSTEDMIAKKKAAYGV